MIPISLCGAMNILLQNFWNRSVLRFCFDVVFFVSSASLVVGESVSGIVYESAPEAVIEMSLLSWIRLLVGVGEYSVR